MDTPGELQDENFCHRVSLFFVRRRAMDRRPGRISYVVAGCLPPIVLAASGEDITRSSDVPRRRAQPGSIRTAWRTRAAGGCSRYASRCVAPATTFLKRVSPGYPQCKAATTGHTNWQVRPGDS